uniref:Ig-like domain-containing protein n=1 Tax=Sinocyclocheilus grahami TaxID=75366 RepID=A0A672L372_SINGR
MGNSQLAMRNSSCCCLCFSVFGNVAVNHTTTLFVNHGESAKIRCNYSRTDDTEIMTVDLQALNHARMCSYIHLNSWQKQSCKDHIRFIWIPEAEEISFELLNLRIKDTGIYICTVRRTAKPPQVDLGVERRPDGSPMILCSVEFYHDSLEQLWIRDGDVLNSSYSNKSFNGSFSQQSYLIIPPQTFNDTIYSCWVNHSSLNKPLVANLSSSVCYETGGKFRAVTARQQSVSHVGMSFTPEPVLHDHLQSEMLYSTLGDHHPVLCSPAVARSFEQ